jgi:transglutaminase-like putative cysteine protease
MKHRVRHTTEYAYRELVSLSHHVAHLAPRGDNGQVCLSRTLTITPKPAFRRERIDAFGNRAVYFSIEEPHQRLVVAATAEVDVPAPARAPLPAASWESVRDRLAGERRADIVEAYAFTFDSPHVHRGAALRALAEPSFTRGRPLLEATLELTKRIHAEFTYDPRATNVSTPLADVLSARRGVCQDFSHLAIGCLRSLGLPCRYVSGYLLTRPPPGRPRLVGADASHAWIATYVPDFGWVDFDPTNGLMPAEEHITIASGRDFGDVVPVQGVILGGGAHTVEVSVDVTPMTPMTLIDGTS